MTPAEIIAAINAARTVIDIMVANSQAQSGFTDEDKARILAAAGQSDQAFDNAVAAARARLAAGGDQ